MTKLYQKMHAVMVESETLEKNMKVGLGQNQYRAVSESNVLNNVKPLLKKHGLILFPVKVESEEIINDITTSKGTSSRLLTKVHATYKICDIESGESELIETVGNGVDSQDKGSGKAMTYAYKALLQKTFMLFSGEDTDIDHSDDTTAKNLDEFITKEQAELIEKLLEQLNPTIKEKMLDGYKIKDISEIKQSQYIGAHERLKEYLEAGNEEKVVTQDKKDDNSSLMSSIMDMIAMFEDKELEGNICKAYKVSSLEELDRQKLLKVLKQLEIKAKKGE